MLDFFKKIIDWIVGLFVKPDPNKPKPSLCGEQLEKKDEKKD